MWIEHIELRGFGRLTGRFAFSPALTLVVGDNESGKSTLHEALVRTLFGFSRTERRRAGGTGARERLEPWGGGPFGVNAIVHGRDGRRLRVEWDFAAHLVRLLEADTGTDLSRQVRGRGDETSLGEFLVGLDLDQFREISVIDQGDISAVERSDSLVSVLQRAVESGGGEHGIDLAVELIGSFLRDDMGLHQTQLRPLPGGRYARLSEEASDLEEQLEACREARREIATLAAAAAKHEATAARLRGELYALEQALLVRTAADLDARLKVAERHANEVTREPPAARRVPPGVGDLIRGRFATRDQLGAALRRAEDDAVPARVDLAALDEQRAAVLVRLEPLAGFDRVDRRHEAELRELMGQREALATERRQLQPVRVPPRDARLAWFRAVRDDMTALEARARSRVRLAAAAAALISGFGAAVAGALVHPALYAVTASGLVIALVLLSSRWRAAAALARSLAEFGGRNLAELDRRLADEDRAQSVAEALAARFYAESHALTAREREIETQIDRVLGAVDPGGTGSRQERVARYSDACARSVEHAHVRAELEHLNRLAAERSRAVQEVESRLAELEAFNRDSSLHLDLADIPAGPLDERLAELEARLAADAADDELQRQVQAARKALVSVLAGESLESLAERAAAAASRVTEHIGAHGRLEPEPGDADELEARVRSLTEQQRRAELEAASLRARIGERERSAGDPAAIEEALGRINGRVGRIELVRDALVTARDELRAAARDAHRQFAPHLNRALGEFLPSITGGRYREAVVGDDLDIQVKAPETARMVPVDQLSRGTRDQIYLIERIQMVRLLDAQTGRAPLLLDDPLARFDGCRLEQAITLLAEVARERQVILFSDDRTLIDLVSRLDSPTVVIDLPTPPLTGH